MYKFPLVKQLNSEECGICCLSMIFKYYNIHVSLDKLRRLVRLSSNGISFKELKKIAHEYSFKTVSAKITIDQLLNLEEPCITHWENKHFVTIYKVTKSYVYIADPLKGCNKISIKKFISSWNKSQEPTEVYGHCLLLIPTESSPKDIVEGNKTEKNIFFKYIKDLMTRFLKYYPSIIIAFLLGNIIQLLTPFLTQGLVDIGIGNRDIAFIHLMIIGAIFLYVSRFVIDFFRSYILMHISVRINITLVHNFLKKLIRLPLSFYENRKLFDIIKRIEDHDALKMFMTEDLFSAIFNLSSLFILLGVLCYYSFIFFVIYLVGTALYVLWITFFLKQRQALNRVQFGIDTNAREIVYDLIDGIQDLKVYNYGNKKLTYWTEEQKKLYQYDIKSLINSNAIRLGGLFFNYTKDMVIMLFAALEVVDGNITVGAMMAIQGLLAQLIIPINQLIHFFQSLSENQVSVERITDIYNVKTPETQHVYKSVEKSSIQVSNLNFGYKADDRQILSDITCSLKKNSLTLVLGKSGCGKTTLLKLLLGYYEDFTGDIKINDKTLKSININQWENSYSCLLQNSFVFYDTVLDNIVMGDEFIDRDRLMWAIKTACFDEIVKKLPHDLDTFIGRKGHGLSRGQLQRMLLARCFYKNVNYIFLDEATNALDPITERKVLNNIKNELSDKTILFISHNVQTIEMADNIIVLDEGRIAESGTCEELLRKKGMLYEMYYSTLEQKKSHLSQGVYHG